MAKSCLGISSMCQGSLMKCTQVPSIWAWSRITMILSSQVSQLHFHRLVLLSTTRLPVQPFREQKSSGIAPMHVAPPNRDNLIFFGNRR